MDAWVERKILRTTYLPALAVCLLALAGGAVAETGKPPNSHALRWEHYEGTTTCLECHEQQAMDFFHSQHYQWNGGTPNLVNTEEDTQLGKLSMINDFCTSPGGDQWIGKVKNDAGKTLSPQCLNNATGHTVVGGIDSINFVVVLRQELLHVGLSNRRIPVVRVGLTDVDDGA